MSVHITPNMLKDPRTRSLLTKVVEDLSESVAGVNYSDPGHDDFAELDEAIGSGLTEFLLGLELPEQTSRGEAAFHHLADLDRERAAGL